MSGLQHLDWEMVKVLIVDDSIFMRKTLAAILEQSPFIKVVGLARNGEEGLELIRQHDPDVVTLDIEMPKMDGLTALRHIMMEMPRPVIMISSLTKEGAEATLKAMELGASDFIPKQAIPDESYAAKLRETVLMVAKSASVLKYNAARRSSASASSLALRQVKADNAPPQDSGRRILPSTETALSGVRAKDVVAIGVSTGGPPVVQKILSELPENFPAGILIAQHMPAAFTGPFAKRLDNLSKLTVQEAQGGEKLKPGLALVAPGGKHISITPTLEVIVSEQPLEALYKPSVNVLMESAGRSLGRKVLGVMLTGMGSDGAEGAKVLKECGGKLIAQSEKTCVVYGMPKAVVDAGLADEIVDKDDLAAAIVRGVQNR